MSNKKIVFGEMQHHVTAGDDHICHTFYKKGKSPYFCLTGQNVVEILLGFQQIICRDLADDDVAGGVVAEADEGGHG